MFGRELRRNVKERVDDACFDLGASENTILGWRGSRTNPMTLAMNKHRQLMECILACIQIERRMALDARAWLDNLSEAQEPSDEATETLLRYYLLFNVIDSAACASKSEITSCYGDDDLLSILRRSVHLHWRVVNIFKGSKDTEELLGSDFSGHVEQIHRLLKAQKRDIFVCHASADTEEVLFVLNKWQEEGEKARGNIEKAISDFVVARDVEALGSTFDRNAGLLDSLSLRTWIDVDRMVPGDIADDQIFDVIEKSRVVLVFFTKNFKDAWYANTREKPKIREHAEARARDRSLREIPVVMSVEAWKERKCDWWTEEREPLACPMNAHKLDNEDYESLRQRAIASLTDARLISVLAGDHRR